MKIFKSLFTSSVIWLLVLILLVLSGCGAGTASGGRNEDGPSPETRLQVVATIFPQYDFARQIAGDRADVHMLLKPGEEVHSYEPTPRDIRMIQNCDLFIYTGGENDVWIENILEGMDVNAVRLLDLVETFEEEHLEGMMPEKGEHSHGEDEHSHDEDGSSHDEDGSSHNEEELNHNEENHSHGEEEEEEEPDEHVWTSPENCAIMIGSLTDEFCRLDPAQEKEYRENGEAYREKFISLDEEYRKMVSSSSARTIIFGDRFPFRYLAEAYGLTCFAAFPGCSSESEPSAATIAFLIEKAASEKAPVIFKIEFSNGNIAQAICEAAQKRTGEPMQVLQLHSCHNLTRDEFAAGETCLSLMTKNLEALRAALE